MENKKRKLLEVEVNLLLRQRNELKQKMQNLYKVYDGLPTLEVEFTPASAAKVRCPHCGNDAFFTSEQLHNCFFCRHWYFVLEKDVGG
jgi:hypothetical protein